MSIRDYTIRWLSPEDSQQIAALEARVHVSEHRAGDLLIGEQLKATESDGRNLSLGLYHGGRLVGFSLAFVMSDRREMADFFDAPLPPQLDPSASTIYVADWVVEPEHRRAAKLMVAKFAEILRQRDDLRHLPMDAFATSEYADKWCAPNAYFDKLGRTFVGRHPFHDARLKKTLYWLQFNPINRAEKTRAALPSAMPGSIRSPEEWDAIRPYWNELLERTPEVSPLQSWEYLRTWYAHFGVIEQPFAIVVRRDNRPVALAPFQIASRRQRGRHRRVLTNLASTAEAQISRVLVAGNDEAAMTAIADHVFTNAKSWENLDLTFHPSQTALVEILKQRLRRAHLAVRTSAGPSEYHLNIRGQWREFLAGRPASLIDACAAGESELAQRGPVRFEIAPVSSVQALDSYFDLEHYAPDDELGRGACASSQHMSFYRALASAHAAALGLHIGILHSGTERAAGLIGFLWRRQLYVVHITRTEAFAPAHVERTALARLIEWCFAQGACDSVNLSALPESDARAWATRTSGSTRLRAHEAAVSAWWRHAIRGFTS